MSRWIKTYSELITFPTFEERFEYCKCLGKVGDFTFGSKRYLNQQFYRSAEWKRVRREVIIRDNGCDLGIEGHEIYGSIHVHHLVTLEDEDIVNATEFLLNPEFLICVSELTHKALTYGDIGVLPTGPAIRTPNDTCPWR